MKVKSSYFCQECGYESPKWLGKCPSCQSWNTLTEEIIEHDKNSLKKSFQPCKDYKTPVVHPVTLDNISIMHTPRLTTSSVELDRVLGGGLVAGSLVLIGGQPGIGKSTLMLQILIGTVGPVLYVSGEESAYQIKMRAERIGLNRKDCYIYTETSVQKILKEAAQIKPSLIVIDSIQTVFTQSIDSTAGSVSQVRESTAEFQRMAKETGTPIILIGHITKEGGLAGPKILEHIVDVVLQFEGDQHHAYRILRTLKNRFGSTDEIGIFSMELKGLREVSNPSEILVSPNKDKLSGTTIAASIEGIRPLLIETQALVSPAIYGTPQRSATGFDLRRLSMLLAVLEKRIGLPFGQRDVFINIAGGIKVTDPAIDLCIVASLISSLQDIYVDTKVCFAGEVGLSGEIRPVSRIEARIQEASRLGFKAIYIPEHKSDNITSKNWGMEVIALSKIDDLLSQVYA